MFQCPKCNAELQDDARFCHACGAKAEKPAETPQCPKCKAPVPADARFCPVCGEKLEAPAPEMTETPLVAEVPQAPEVVETPIEDPTPVPPAPAVMTAPAAPVVVTPPVSVATPAPKAVQEKSKKKSKIGLFIGLGAGAVAVFLTLCIVVLCVVFGGNKVHNYGLYMKDGEMFYTGIPKVKPVQITEKMIDGSVVSKEDIAKEPYALGYYTHVTEDGKYIFYLDRIGADGAGSLSLYYRRADRPNQEPVKIDSQVYLYAVSENGKTVTYLKEGGMLYRHDLTDREKIAGDVVRFSVSEDGKNLIYQTQSGDVYFQKAGKDREKMASEVSYILQYNEDITAIYFLKEGNLYYQEAGKDREKILSDIHSTLQLTEDGKIYYVKSTETTRKLMDFVNDDMFAADSAVVQPTYPDYPTYPSYFDYLTYEEYQAAYQKVNDEYQAALDEYREAMDAYYDKERRDTIRKNLEETTFSRRTYSLWYYDGEESVKLSDSFNIENYTVASKAAVLVYSEYAQSERDKLNLSEISSAYEVESLLREDSGIAGSRFLAVEDSVTPLEDEDASYFRIAPDGKRVFYMIPSESGSDKGEMYEMEISDGQPETPELYDDEVVSSYFYFVEDMCVYFKDVKGDAGDLYINKTRIDYEVSIYNYEVIDAKTAVYLTDESSDGTGMLKYYRSGKITKIADDVASYEVTPGGDVLYLTDYSTEYYRGDLYLFTGKKSKKIDEDVNAIVPIYDMELRGAGNSY